MLETVWKWLVSGLADPPFTVAVDATYLRRVAVYRWGLLVVYGASLALSEPVLGEAWDWGAFAFVGSGTGAYTVHMFAAARRGELYRWFWWIAPFADVAAIGMIMATTPGMIFLAWGVAILPLSFFTAALSWRGSYLMLLRLVAASGFAVALVVHARAGVSIGAGDIAVAALLLTVGSWVTVRTAVEQRTLMTRLEAQSLTDPLTGLRNRRALSQEMSHPFMRLSERRSLAVLVFDLDDFKQVNDAHGHDAGDDRLRQIADVFGANLRKEDLMYRYGGDEFVVLAPVAGPEEAASLAARLQQAALSRADTRLSVGYALVPPGTPQVDEALRLADRALLTAKRNGKGRVVAAEDATAAVPS